jgi:CTP synthase
VEHGLDELICQKLSLKSGPLNMEDYRDLVHRIRNPQNEVTIAVVGKYIEHRDAYKSIYESLDHAGFHHSTQIHVKRIEAEELERQGPEMVLKGVDGVLVPGGFGMRGIEGKIQAIQYARQSETPFFGICLGMQCAVIEFARNVLDLKDANSTEFAADTPHPVICLLEGQKTINRKGGTMRLGAQPCVLVPDTRAARAYASAEISERHRHRYEFNPEYRKEFVQSGMRIAGTSPDGTLVEIVELAAHPWFVAVQYHPEFKSKPNIPHPLFRDFVQACLQRRLGRAVAISAPGDSIRAQG